MVKARTIALLAAIIVAPAAAAQQLSDEWQFRAAIYGWLPDVKGSTTFPAGSGSINVDASQIISSLKFTFMGTLEAHKGRWGVFTDFIYLDVGGSKSGTRDLTVGNVTLPPSITLDATLNIKSVVWTLAGSYRVLTDADASLDVLAGARLLAMQQTLDWQFSTDIVYLAPVPRTGTSVLNVNIWDGIVGARGRLAFGADRQWFVPYYADVGTGDSQLTWQAVAGIGYVYHWGEVFAAWRYLDYNFKSGSKIADVSFNGPGVGVAFRW
jgi:hypothetical protein